MALVFGARAELADESGVTVVSLPPVTVSPLCVSLFLLPRRPLAVDGAASMPVASVGHQRVQSGERKPPEVWHEWPGVV